MCAFEGVVFVKKNGCVIIYMCNSRRLTTNLQLDMLIEQVQWLILSAHKLADGR